MCKVISYKEKLLMHHKGHVSNCNLDICSTVSQQSLSIFQKIFHDIPKCELPVLESILLRISLFNALIHGHYQKLVTLYNLSLRRRWFLKLTFLTATVNLNITENLKIMFDEFKFYLRLYEQTKITVKNSDKFLGSLKLI